MPKQIVHFMALLANVDKSILRMPLSHSFKVEYMSNEEGQRRISALEGLHFLAILEKLTRFQCLNSSEDRFYFISNRFESDIKIADQGVLMGFPSEAVDFNKELIEGYLKPLIQQMRLFKEGNIRMPLTYYYIDRDVPRSFFAGWSGVFVTPGQFTLETLEVPGLVRFIQSTRLPFAKPFLQLAFENFELSYQIHNMNLSFLSLMISLENLFNPGGQELRYTLSRNTAVLLGKDKGDSNKIFSRIKDLYQKRSNIVHWGKSNIINREDLLELRHYVRESIKEINKISRDKTSLLDLLNASGFGERPWRK